MIAVYFQLADALQGGLISDKRIADADTRVTRDG